MVVQKPCFDFAETYHERLNGMVEEQMRQAIHAVGSSWYTAWVDAGQPNLRTWENAALFAKNPMDSLEKKADKMESDSIENAVKNGGKMIGRAEDN